MPYFEPVIRVYPEEIKGAAHKDCASFDKPKVCGYFSIDKNREYIPDSTNLKYFYPRSNIDKHNGLDLNAGIENAVRKPELNERIDHMLRFILQNVPRLRDRATEHVKLLTDFVCFRGLLTKIACSLYLEQEFDTWAVLATKWKGTIYLCEENMPRQYSIPEQEMNKFCSWGYKFEQYMVTDAMNREPDTTQPVLECEEFCCMFESRLGKHRLLYGAEMDAVQPSDSAASDDAAVDWANTRFVELKTSKVVRSHRDERTLRHFKFIKWWAQCFLVNIEHVHCGFRDHRGLVTDVRKFDVRELPKLAKGVWDWRVCLNFCNIFLDIVKSVIPADTNDPHKVWRFEWVPQLEHFKTDLFEGPSPHSFLPDWYINHI